MCMCAHEWVFVRACMRVCVCVHVLVGCGYTVCFLHVHVLIGLLAASGEDFAERRRGDCDI